MTCELSVLCHEGDTKTIWDPDNAVETAAAKAQFDSLIEQGFTAFRVKKDGEKGERMNAWDPSAGKVILVPRMVGG